MQSMSISALGVAILPAYFLVTVLIGWLTRRKSTSANDYLNASKSLPLWVVAASFLAANCGALEIVGLSAMAAEFGAKAFHFYWIGAIPVMIVLSIWVMPAYIRSGIRSIPEYLEKRFGLPLRLLNAYVLAVMVLMLAGISLYALAQVLLVVLHWSFTTGVLVSAAVVLIYVLLGGVRATIYNEVFQLGVMVAGLLPLAVRSYHYATHVPGTDAAAWHLWAGTPVVSPTAPFDSLGVVFGLGLILSFSYWCTDFVLIQRALAARTEPAARQVPLWAGFGKLVFSLIVVLPGLAAHRLFPSLAMHSRFDQALPRMMTILYGPTLLGLGLTALTASLMSGLAANVSAFAAIWTEDIYRRQLVRNRLEEHYLSVGQWAIAFAIVVSAAASYYSFYFKNLMDQVQMIFSLFSAPLWAVFLLGMTARRITMRGAMCGLLSGIGLALVHHIAVEQQWIQYGSMMAANFYAAMMGFITSGVVAWAVSCIGPSAERDVSKYLLYRNWLQNKGKGDWLLWLLAGALLAACMTLNFVWW